MKPRVAIVGLGLVGGSLARALARKGYPLIGVDTSAEALAAARRSRAFAFVTSALAAALSRADVVVLAAPPRANLALLQRVAGLSRGSPRRLVVTDVSSVKRHICELGASLREIDFVGGHPMAGRERAGFGASEPLLFRGRPWILSPTGSGRARRLVRRIVLDAGARPVILSPREHDRAVAFLSHLPQVLSWALLHAADRDAVARRRLSLAGPAFADMTRIAASPRRLWREIINENGDELRRALRAFRAALSSRSALGLNR